MTATNATVSTNGPRSQVKPGHPQPTFFSPTDKKIIPNGQLFFPVPIGPRGLFPASAVFWSCVPGNVRTFPLPFWQGKFSNRQPPTDIVFPTDNLFFPNRHFFSNRQKICSNGHLFFPQGLGGCFPPLPFLGEISLSPQPKYH